MWILLFCPRQDHINCVKYLESFEEVGTQPLPRPGWHFVGVEPATALRLILGALQLTT
jgi:hypothetical protein